MYMYLYGLSSLCAKLRNVSWSARFTGLVFTDGNCYVCFVPVFLKRWEILSFVFMYEEAKGMGTKVMHGYTNPCKVFKH